MLRERITALFALLQCTNTDIARHAGCSSGNISKLKSGNRAPKPTSHSIALLAEGVYRYADYENLLPVLTELTGSGSTSRETLIPALIAWLYDTDEIILPSRTLTPKSKRLEQHRRQQFGERLDLTMSLLGLSNRQLAGLLNIDISLVSRYRKGIYSPSGNELLAEKLADVLLLYAEKIGKKEELAALCGAKEKEPDTAALTDWLYTVGLEEFSAETARRLLLSLNSFTPGSPLPAAVPDLPPTEEASCYHAVDGLRRAVMRFLTDAAREGGSLLLYSDEPMDWMTEDRGYFTQWAALMALCVRKGVKIRIIHNTNRDESEMVDAIVGWLPLYISGMIEPYVYRREKNTRFFHTFFLHSGRACIQGFFPAGSKDDHWYDYITDKARLQTLEREYGGMLSDAAPFLKTYTPAMADEFRAFCAERSGEKHFLLNALPVFTMTEDLMRRILGRVQAGNAKYAQAFSCFLRERRHFLDELSRHGITMILCPYEAEEPRINLSLSMTEFSAAYTREEYAEHLTSMIKLVENERNFHLVILPRSPFTDIQLVTLKGAAAVLRCREPYAAFVFLNPALTDSVDNYLSALADRSAADRRSVIETLMRIREDALR